MTTSTSFVQMANNQSISLSSALHANTPPSKEQTSSRKFLTLSIFLLLSFFCTTNLWGATQTYSYTFTAKQFSANGSTILNNVIWTLAGDGSYLGYDGTKGQQFGSGSAPYKTLTLSTSGISGTITKIIINTSGAKDVNASFTVSVGGTQWGNSTKLTTTATAYTFTGSQSGEIKLLYTQTSSKALYIKSISVTYETAASHTVTWKVNGETYTTGSPSTSVSGGGKVTKLPTNPTLDCSGKVFAGWTTDPIATPLNEAPDVLFTTVDGSPAIDENTTFHAVFATETGGGSMTDTYDWESTSTGNWLIDEDIVRTATQGVSSSYAGKINTNNTYVTYNKKVAVTNFSFQFKRTSTNTNYNVYIETSTDKSNWSTAATYAMNSFGNGSYTSISKTFDGDTELYVRFHCYNTTAVRYVDNVSISYSGGTTYSDYTTTCTTETVVTLNLNGGTFASNPEGWTQDGNNYKKEGVTGAITLPTPTKTGYNFDGWYDDDTKVDLSYTPSKTVTLVAKWTAKTYTITLDANGGTFVDNRDSQTKGSATFDYIYGTYANYNDAPNLTEYYSDLKRDGYQFDKWVSAGSPWNKLFTSTGDRTIQAQWSKLYSITLSENGTTTTPITQTSTSYTLPTELSAGSCQDDTKELVGWSTVAIPTPGDKPTSNFYDLGETVTLTADQTTFYAVFATVEETTGGTVEATLLFANKAQRTSWSTSKQVWEQNEITFTHDKANGDNIVDNYGPIRCYKNSKITITHTSNEITKIVFDCNTNAYATDLQSSIATIEGVAVSQSSDKVTVSFTSAVESFAVTLSSGQVRLDGISVTTGGGTTTTYSDYSTTCVKLPDPVWEGATIDKTALTVNCGERSSMDGAAQITFSKDKIYGFSNPITIEASEGFLVSTSRTPNGNYQQSVSQSPLVGTEYPNTFNGKFVYVRAEAPAQSDTDLEGTITIKNSKGETLQTFSITADVTCTTYTLTLDDRGTKTTAEYYAGALVPKPEDPTGVCTDPINYVFDGWSVDLVTDENTTSYEKVTFPFDMPAGKTTLYAVYRYVEEGSGDSGDYVKVTENLDDYSGDYLFVYETGNVAFDGGLDDLDVTSNTISVTINSNTIASNATTDAAKFTIAKVDGGYSIQSASGYYIGRSATSNGLSTNETYSANYDLNTITDCKTIKGKGGNILKYNKASDQKRFRYYQSGQEDIALYRKAASYLYTTSPVCGPHLVITEGKEIYVTGGNAGAARDLVMASQKVSYQATRLKTQDGSPEGTPPDVKVATNGITKGGVVTTEVKVTFENTVKELQPDDTYTITGDIVVTYEADANNLKEDIRVQLAVDYPANADARDNFTVHARSLPAEFVVVAKQGDKWYALNADMSGSKAQPANKQIEVDDIENPAMATFAPCNTVYTFEAMPQGASDRISVRFIGMENKYLWSALEGNTGIQNNSKNPTADVLAYNWKLYTTDNVTYQVGNGQNTRMLGLNSSLNFGMYAPVSGLVNDIRILPIDKLCTYNYAPTNLKVSVLKSTSVTLTWDAVAGATKYQYSTDGNTWTDAGTEPTVTINGLTEGKGYTYYIRAYHEDDATKECIDYAVITFTTADCDDVPTDITYTADLNSITVSWTAAAPTATITYNTKEDGTGGGGTIENATSPRRISGGLNPNTTYYIQILADGTCASPIIPVKTEDVKMDIVEWQPDGIVVDINTNEKVKVTLENEVSYGSGTGTVAEDLFFSKYFEGSGSLKMLAIYNGTGKDVDLSTYRIDRGTNGDATDISKTYDLSQLGIIKQGQEIVFYSWPLAKNTQGNPEYSYECSKSYLNNVATKSGQEDNPRWILCGNDPTGKATPIYGDAMNFSGDDPLLLYKSSELIDVFGVSTEQESPASTQICSGRSDEAWSADGVTNMDYGKTTEDFPNGAIPHGVNVDDETITAYTARVIMFRKNTVVSGKNAVTKNTTTFATFAEEWEARQVCMSGDDGDLTCAAYQELGTFNYSEYYTKYESMDQDQEFDTNNRNADGTLTVPITELFKQSCRNIKITLKDAADNVLKEQPYKVPIMITSTQGTDGQAFLALQENLATVEVDNEGNPTGDKTNLTLEQVREICKTCDVVVRDNATLTKIADDAANDHPQVRNIYVYENSSLIVPNGTNYTINNLSLRRNQDAVASVSAYPTALKLPESAAAPISLDFRLSAESWHWFTLPYDCNINEVTWADGTPAQYNTDWYLMTYDGETRAATQTGGNWKAYSGTTINAGDGFIIAINGNINNPAHTYELRFPMAKEVLAAEGTDKTVDVHAWGVETGIRPNHKGWNLVGNPYLAYYQRNNITNFEGLRLGQLTGPDPQTGYWTQTGDVPYVVVPIGAGYEAYEQLLASETDLLPFTAYFVQVGNDGKHASSDKLSISFDHSKLQLSATPMPASIVHRAPSEVNETEEPVIVGVALTNSLGESDKTSLVIADRFTNEYEMQADFFKWFGDYYKYYTKPVLYTIGADQGKRAFNALNEQLATQPIPMGMFAAKAGDYTFALNRRSDLSKVEEVWLHDANTNTYTNLMQNDYNFYTTKTDGGGRFTISVKLAPKVATSIDNVTADKVWATTHTKQVIVNGLENGMHLWLYDATGKLLYTEPTSNYQHTYLVPQTGTYFVSVMNGNQKQTIKVVVE